MKSRIELMQGFIDKYKYTFLLEIGCKGRWTIDKLNIDRKLGIDNDPTAKPDILISSDDFFKQNKDIYDIIFIDGEHCEKQVTKDFNNSLEVLKPGGTIFIHDCLPRFKGHQIMPRVQKMWVGDVWKAVMKLYSRNDIIIQVLDLETGMAIIRRGESESIDIPDKLEWEFYESNRDVIFNPIKDYEI